MSMSNTQKINSRLNFFNFFFNNFDVMHCISSYPDKIQNCNLKSIPFIKNLIKSKKFKKNFRVGWLDHSVNESVIYKSIFKYYAELIEKHVDLDQKRNENHFVHYWLLDNSKRVIKNIISLQNSVEFLGKIVNDEEKKERNWITDNIDALSLLKKIRFKIKKLCHE